jgi:hypothetical protein
MSARRIAKIPRSRRSVLVVFGLTILVSSALYIAAVVLAVNGFAESDGIITVTNDCPSTVYVVVASAQTDLQIWRQQFPTNRVG